MTYTGIDLVYLPEFRKQLRLGGDQLLKKAFNEAELDNREPIHLAGLWAAKEAVIKATGLKINNYRDIVITYNKMGQPQATVNMQKFAISIAHQGQYAVAVATRNN